MPESAVERAYEEWFNEVRHDLAHIYVPEGFKAGYAAAKVPLLARIKELEAAALAGHVGLVQHDDPDIRQCRHPTCAALVEQEALDA